MAKLKKPIPEPPKVEGCFTLPDQPKEVLPEDHEQWEYDYYARRSSGGLAGCVMLLVGIGIAVLTYLGHWILKEYFIHLIN